MQSFNSLMLSEGSPNTDFVIKTNEFKELLNNGKEVEDILVDAYAVAREAVRRIQGMVAYKVQLIGGIILNSGDIAEMRTGEGKTLTGIFPAYLNALTGNGVHIVTVNEYLSGRDRELNAPVFEFLGLTTGLNGSRISKKAKRDAFDYLKDNMVIEPSLKVQRKLNFAIIDEADSILIDEARTPLIISGGSTSRINLYKAANEFAKDLDQQVDIDID
ncbi:hypothetical protein FQA39_LY12978 [Lamprigera yunnana]|nr:hypothetical protein FQA39_LY12978 [Lamprigera yunnana]